MRLGSFNKIMLQILLASVIAGCVVPSKETNLLTVPPIATLRVGNDNSVQPPIELNDPKDKIIILYNHGTTRPQRIENCDAHWNKIPQSLLAIQSEKIRIYYLCSQATESNSRFNAGQYVYNRLKEVEKTLDELIALGVSADNIFLAGHSAGGWVSLMAMRSLGKKFNSAIVFAPAFAGRRSEESMYPWWRQKARPKQIQEMLEAPKIQALVFAYFGDPFNRPEDLKFLTKHYPFSVRIIGYECAINNKHLVHLNDCREADTTQAISRYIKEMTIHQLESTQ